MTTKRKAAGKVRWEWAVVIRLDRRLDEVSLKSWLNDYWRERVEIRRLRKGK
jgi:hypothetical protein